MVTEFAPPPSTTFWTTGELHSPEGSDPIAEVPSGPGASNGDRHFSDIAPMSDDQTNVRFRESAEDGNGGHGPEWTRGVKFHRRCEHRKFQSHSEATLLIWRRVFPSCESL